MIYFQHYRCSDCGFDIGIPQLFPRAKLGQLKPPYEVKCKMCLWEGYSEDVLKSTEPTRSDYIP